MRVEDYTTASTSILISKEAVLDDVKLTSIITRRLSFHDSSVFVLTHLDEASRKIYFIFAYLDLQLFFQ